MELTKELLSKLDGIDEAESAIKQLEQDFQAAEVAREEARNNSVTIRVALEDAKKALASLKSDFATATIQERKKP